MLYKGAAFDFAKDRTISRRDFQAHVCGHKPVSAMPVIRMVRLMNDAGIETEIEYDSAKGLPSWQKRYIG